MGLLSCRLLTLGSAGDRTLTARRGDGTAAAWLSGRPGQPQARAAAALPQAAARGQRLSLAEASPYGDVEPPAYPGRAEDKFWSWKGYQVRYHHHRAATAGRSRGVVLLIHGFGGNAEHWRKNGPQLAQAGYEVYAIDLLGYGFSAKPDPKSTVLLKVDPTMPERFYNIPMWAEQAATFLQDVCGVAPGDNGDAGALVITNSVGGSVGLQMAVDFPGLVRAVALLDPSLRMLHESNQAPWEKPLVPAVQWALRETSLGEYFFQLVATPTTVRAILRAIYPANPGAVDEELVDCILKPGLSSPNATRVFMDFISYSAGPLIQDQLSHLGASRGRAPVWIGWGAKDPWEPMERGRELYAGLPAVERFQVLPGLGHCPMDEAPEVVNPFLLEFLEAYS